MKWLLVLGLALLLGVPTLCPAQADSVIVVTNTGGVVHQERSLTRADWGPVSDDTLDTRGVALDSAAMRAYRADPKLDYDRRVSTRWPGFITWLLRHLFHFLSQLFGTRTGSWIMKHLDWILIGLAVVGLVVYFRKRLLAGVFSAKPHRARQVTEVEEHLERMDLDALLAKAEQDANWRLALRYQYLLVLRRLVDDGRITWEPRYTDHDYLGQLKEPGLRSTFAELSFLFKWVWYGDAPLDAPRYQALRPSFETFHQRTTR